MPATEGREDTEAFLAALGSSRSRRAFLARAIDRAFDLVLDHGDRTDPWCLYTFLLRMLGDAVEHCPPGTDAASSTHQYGQAALYTIRCIRDQAITEHHVHGWPDLTAIEADIRTAYPHL